VVTVRYNLLSQLYPAQETDIFDFVRRHRVGVLIKQALAQGLLLRRLADPLPAFSTADHRSRDPQFHPSALAVLDTRLAPVRARFGDSPAELARIALRYALQRAPDAAVLVGFRDSGQIQTTLTCLGDPLREDETAEIRALLHPPSDEGIPS
jgi:1-deoxyxylulose-5-phosphate synthase